MRDSRKVYTPQLDFAVPYPSVFDHLKPVRVEHGCIGDTWKLVKPNGKVVYYLKRHKLSSSHDSIKEADVLRWLRDKLPVPEVVEFWTDKDYHWLLMSVLQGIPAHELIGDYTPEEMLRLMVEGLKRIREVDIKDCTFDESIPSKLRRVRRNIDLGLLRSDVYPEGSGPRAEDDYLWLTDHIPEESGVFSHGDYCLPNALVEDGRITGFVDWGEGGISDPWQDAIMLVESLCYNYHTPEKFFEYGRIISEALGLAGPFPERLVYFRLLNHML
jgi:aminoglycoside phosphotransferase